MVTIKRGNYSKEYPNKVMETILMDKKIKDDFSKFCKEKKIKKKDLIEKFYKTILLRHREGSLNLTNNYITIHVVS